VILYNKEERELIYLRLKGLQSDIIMKIARYNKIILH